MAIEQRLRVTQPVTTNGRTQRTDKDGKVVMKVSIVPVRAMKELNSLNSRYEDPLKMQIEVVNFDTKTQKVVEANGAEDIEGVEEIQAPAEKKGRGRKKVSAESLDEIFGK